MQRQATIVLTLLATLLGLAGCGIERRQERREERREDRREERKEPAPSSLAPAPVPLRA